MIYGYKKDTGEPTIRLKGRDKKVKQFYIDSLFYVST